MRRDPRSGRSPDASERNRRSKLELGGCLRSLGAGKEEKEVGGCLRSLRIAKEIKIYLIL